MAVPPYWPARTPAVDASQYFTREWSDWTRDVSKSFRSLPFPQKFTIATQPKLRLDDEGFVGVVTDYMHTVEWDGAAWRFAGGDPGNAYYAVFATAPQQVGWVLCDGSTKPYLVVNAATLTTANQVLPNVAGQYFRQ